MEADSRGAGETSGSEPFCVGELIFWRFFGGDLVPFRNSGLTGDCGAAIFRFRFPAAVLGGSVVGAGAGTDARADKGDGGEEGMAASTWSGGSSPTMLKQLEKARNVEITQNFVPFSI